MVAIVTFYQATKPYLSMWTRSGIPNQYYLNCSRKASICCLKSCLYMDITGDYFLAYYYCMDFQNTKILLTHILFALKNLYIETNGKGCPVYLNYIIIIIKYTCTDEHDQITKLHCIIDLCKCRLDGAITQTMLYYILK